MCKFTFRNNLNPNIDASCFMAFRITGKNIIAVAVFGTLLINVRHWSCSLCNVQVRYDAFVPLMWCAAYHNEKISRQFAVIIFLSGGE